MEVGIHIEVERKADGLPKTPYRYRTMYAGEELGVWESPEFPAARVLVEKGVSRDAGMVVYRGSTPVMRGRLGWRADHAVREDDKTSPVFVKYRPFPRAKVERQPEINA